MIAGIADAPRSERAASRSLADTDGTYYNWIWSQPNDPGYADTNYYLNVYRLALQSRSLQVGPPPYANCP